MGIIFCLLLHGSLTWCTCPTQVGPIRKISSEDNYLCHRFVSFMSRCLQSLPELINVQMFGTVRFCVALPGVSFFSFNF